MKILRLIIFTLFCGQISSLEFNKAWTFLGEIKSPVKSNKLSFCLYFNGDSITIEDGNFIFKSNTDLINVLITDPENILIKSEENKLATLTLKEGSKYKFYFFDKVREASEYYWCIREEEIPIIKKVLIIPLNTLIFPMSPEFVDENFENKKNKVKNALLKLPIFKLKGDPEKIKQEIVKSCLALIDFKPFHSRPKVEEIKSDNLKVSMIL